jgi:hypothetical protein
MPQRIFLILSLSKDAPPEMQCKIRLPGERLAVNLGPRPCPRHIEPMVKQFVSHRPKTVPGRKPAKREESPKDAAPDPNSKAPKEIGGPSGPEPTRYGDWERKGICVDF